MTTYVAMEQKSSFNYLHNQEENTQNQYPNCHLLRPIHKQFTKLHQEIRDNVERLNRCQETEPPKKRAVVLALFAPQNYTNKIKKNFNPSLILAEKKLQKRTAVSVYKLIHDDPMPCCNFIRNCGLKLSGCAVISEGIFVVEGGIASVKKFMKLIFTRKRLANEDEFAVKLIWQGKVKKPCFPKFSILHCNSKLAARKFFCNHGVSHYWDLALSSA